MSGRRDPWSLANYALDRFTCPTCFAEPHERCKSLFDIDRYVHEVHAHRKHLARPFWRADRPADA